MRLTPLDVRKQEFRKGMRGLDTDEVYAFLATVADEYEAVLNDNKALRERLLELDDKVQEYRNMEKTLRDTLLTAERVTVEAKDSARREAELIIKEAQLEAEKGARDVKDSAMRLRQEIHNLKQQRDSYLARMKAVVESHLKYLDAAETDFAEDETRLDQDIKQWSREKEVPNKPKTTARSTERTAATPKPTSPPVTPSATPPATPSKEGAASIETPKTRSFSGDSTKPEPTAPAHREPVETDRPSGSPTDRPMASRRVDEVDAMADPAENGNVAPKPDAASSLERVAPTAIATEEAPADSKPSLKDLLDRVIDDHAGGRAPAPSKATGDTPTNGGSPDTEGDDDKWSLSRLKSDILARARGDEKDRSDD